MALSAVPHPEGAKRPSRTMHRAGQIPADTIEVRVYYEDTDAAGMVYHANYLRFAERGRTEMLRRIGFGQRRLREDSGIGFAVRRCTVEYRAPARLDDALTITTRIAAAGAATLSMAQEIRRDDEIIAELDVLVACIGRDGRPRRLPEALRRALVCHSPVNPVPATPMSK